MGREQYWAKLVRPPWRLTIICTIYLVLSAGTNLLVPPGEAPDEPEHIAYVQFLLREGRLPKVDLDSSASEFHQPPLFYMLAAIPGALLPESRLQVDQPLNPLSYSPADSNPDNKNRFVHGPDTADPWGRDAYPIHLLRLASTAFGLAGIILTYRAARKVLPRYPQLWPAAAAILAFNPQFILMTSVVNNDAAVPAAVALTLWLGALALEDGSWRPALYLGLVIGGSILLKPTFLPLAGVGLWATAWVPLRTRQWPRLAGRVALCGLALALLSGWWFARNLLLYGDLLATGPHSQIYGQPVYQSLPEFLRAIWASFRGFWANLAWGNYLLPPLAYGALAVATILAAVGGALALRDVDRDRRPLALLLLSIGMAGAGFAILYAYIAPFPSGRLLFTAAPALAIWFAMGLHRLHRALPATFTLGLLGLSLYVLFFLIAPAYQLPLAGESALAQASHKLRVDVAGQIELVAYDLSPTRVRTGEPAQVTLYWRALQDGSLPLVTTIQLLTRSSLQRILQVDKLSGSSMYPADLWQAGDLIVETVELPVPENSPAPVTTDVALIVNKLDAPGSLPIKEADARLLNAQTIILGELHIVDGQSPAPSVSVDYDLGDSIKLTGYDLSLDDAKATADLRLHFQSLRPTAVDYTVFAHIVDGSGHLVAQHDGQPSGGDFPTSDWRPGDTLVDSISLSLPGGLAGDYQLLVGMYQLETGNRLPVTGQDGRLLADGAIPLVLTSSKPGSQ